MAAGDPYFDATDDEHKNLLPDSIRGADELANVAAEAEADMIAHYTIREPADSAWDAPTDASFPVSGSVVGRARTELTDSGGDGISIYVYLKGYAADPAEAEQNFAAAMRREIAGVIAWRLRKWNREPGLASESSGEWKSRTYRKGADRPFPPGFGRWLRPYDTREPVHCL